MDFQVIFQLIILLFSVVIHEVSHGTVANYLGDPTAKNEGRLTLNPLAHLDLWGSFLVPLFLALAGFTPFGWAKPVPYNPYNLRDQKKGPAMIGLAGPLSNLAIAVMFGMTMRIFLFFGINSPMIDLFAVIVYINIFLAIFNLFPIPPLDGSKLLFALLPAKYEYVQKAMEENFLILVMIFFLFGVNFIVPVVNFLFNIIVG